MFFVATYYSTYILPTTFFPRKIAIQALMTAFNYQHTNYDGNNMNIEHHLHELGNKYSRFEVLCYI